MGKPCPKPSPRDFPDDLPMNFFNESDLNRSAVTLARRGSSASAYFLGNRDDGCHANSRASRSTSKNAFANPATSA